MTRFNPDAVFILIGINDIVKQKSSELFQGNLLELVRRIRSTGAIPILQTYGKILYAPENEKYLLRYNKLPEYNAVIRQIAADESIILIDHDRCWQENICDEQSLKYHMAEAIHPGGLGHLAMAKLIFKTLNISDPESFCCNPTGTPWSLA